ncbi:MAG TPA: DUF2252 family protein [Bryobacteraceae bacterium]|nr:DUF2252 family protein [Bryobacteraceae bacterium]
MNIFKATERYEAWLSKRIPLLPGDLALKHQHMSEAPFPFLRATFYRWAQLWPEVSPTSADAPELLAVGDLHVENFGTWRDVDGRLVWGINDFDEVGWMPYTCDLVRLTTSAHFAISGGHLRLITPAKASKAILDGYRAALRAGGRVFVLAEHHPVLREMAVERLKRPELFWEKMLALKTHTGKIPSSAAKAMKRMMPDPKLKYRVVHRVAGLGSLGRLRFVALADWHGGSIAREAKELTTSAWLWAHPAKRKTKIFYREILNRSVRCPDPFAKPQGRWMLRRLAPDCSRIELCSLPEKHDAEKLLFAMGWETANVHLGSAKASMLLKDLAKRPPTWLHRAAEEMFEATMKDWQEWKKQRQS